MILQAETALLEARIRAEVMEEQAFEEPADVQPEKGLHDKISSVVRWIRPVLGLGVGRFRLRCK